MRLIDKDKLLEELIEGQKAGLGLIWGSKYANINSIDDAIETVEYADEIDLEEHDRQIRVGEREKILTELSNKVMVRLNNNRNAISWSNIDSEIFGKICAYDNVMGFIQELEEQK